MSGYIQSLFADRIGGSQFGKNTQIYKFEKIKRAKRAALEANPELSQRELARDMGISLGKVNYCLKPPLSG